MGSPRILVVDDDPDIRRILIDRLQMYGYEVLTASDGTEALEKVQEISPELVLLDILIPDPDGMKVLGRIKREHPETLVIMITAYGTVRRAVEAMKQGAYDFIEKPFDPDIIKIVVDKALERQALVMENEYLRSELRGEYGEIIGKSQKMMEVLKTIEKAAPSDSTVLITGESGTGKELVASALHRNSLRRERPFIPVNCAAIPHELAESELFGHEKGAFTSATGQRLGKFEVADGATIFLDEIRDLAPEIQAKLLRVLQDGTFQRVGGNREISVDVRLIAATNKDLEEEVRAGRFREDLFYRVKGVSIHLPPLREIREDIPLLVEHFLREHSAALNRRGVQITDEAMDLLVNYRWRGNVRELRHCIESTILLTDSDLIRPEHLPSEIRSGEFPVSTQAGIVIKPGTDLKKMEKELILKTLDEVDGNRKKAAERLGMKVRTLYNRLREYKDEGQA